MTRFSQVLTKSFAVAAMCIALFTAAMAQKTIIGFDREVRPFDFSDDFYRANGITPEFMTERRNGTDGLSVFDRINDPDRRDVRITATRPAYAAKGEPVYWNPYGTAGDIGIDTQAKELAKIYPIFFFPSAYIRDTERQAALIAADESYYSKNPLGIALMYSVQYTKLIDSPRGRYVMRILGSRNGFSLDGTPIIKTMAELDSLIRDGFAVATANAATSDRAPIYLFGRILQNLDNGAIAPDAFITLVRDANGQPLEAERHFADQFECLQKGGTGCM